MTLLYLGFAAAVGLAVGLITDIMTGGVVTGLLFAAAACLRAVITTD